MSKYEFVIEATISMGIDVEADSLEAAIAEAQDAPEPLCSRFIEPSVMAITMGANRDCEGNGTNRCQKCARLKP
jgi:hypothetical protein